MKILDAVEGLMENVIEGVFRRNTKRPLQPIEVGKKLISVMESHKRVSLAKTYVPNHFCIYFHPEQLEELTTLQNTLIQELKGVLHQKAEKEHLSFIGNLKIEFHEEPSLHSGIINVEAYFLENSPEKTEEFKLSSEQSANIHTRVFSNPELSVSNHPRLLVKNDEEHRVFELSEPKNYSIGRSIKCDFVIEDHNISRIQAQLELVNDQWHIIDHSSTNGTFINEQKISKQQLTNGDQIRIGTTLLIYQDDE